MVTNCNPNYKAFHGKYDVKIYVFCKAGKGSRGFLPRLPVISIFYFSAQLPVASAFR